MNIPVVVVRSESLFCFRVMSFPVKTFMYFKSSDNGGSAPNVNSYSIDRFFQNLNSFSNMPHSKKPAVKSNKNKEKLGKGANFVSWNNLTPPSHSAEPEPRCGYVCVGRVSIYVIDEADGEIKVYPMPLTVANTIAGILKNKGDLEDIVFCVSRVGYGLGTRYEVSTYKASKHVSFEKKYIIEEIIDKYSIVDILNNEVGTRNIDVKIETIGRFDILDFG